MKSNKDYLQIEQFITKLEISAKKVNVITRDIAMEYFDINDDTIKNYTFERTKIKMDIILDYLDKFLLDLEKLNNFCEHTYK